MAQQNILKGHLKASRPINCDTQQWDLTTQYSFERLKAYALCAYVRGRVCVLMLEISRVTERDRQDKVWAHLQAWLHHFTLVLSPLGIFSKTYQIGKRCKCVMMQEKMILTSDTQRDPKPVFWHACSNLRFLDRIPRKTKKNKNCTNMFFSVAI